MSGEWSGCVIYSMVNTVVNAYKNEAHSNNSRSDGLMAGVQVPWEWCQVRLKSEWGPGNEESPYVILKGLDYPKGSGQSLREFQQGNDMVSQICVLETSLHALYVETTLKMEIRLWTEEKLRSFWNFPSIGHEGHDLPMGFFEMDGREETDSTEVQWGESMDLGIQWPTWRVDGHISVPGSGWLGYVHSPSREDKDGLYSGKAQWAQGAAYSENLLAFFSGLSKTSSDSPLHWVGLCSWIQVSGTLQEEKYATSRPDPSVALSLPHQLERRNGLSRKLWAWGI